MKVYVRMKVYQADEQESESILEAPDHKELGEYILSRAVMGRRLIIDALPPTDLGGSDG